MKHFKKIFALLAAMMTVLAFVACSKGTLTIKSAGGIKKIKSLTEPAKIIVEYSIDAADLSDIKNSISATGQPVQLDLSKTALNEIGKEAFTGCTSLTSITIPNSVTKIGDEAFGGCTGLTGITIPDSVTEIGSFAFRYCTGLTSITIPDSVKEIGNDAFYGCTGLTSITISDSVKEIDWSAFSDFKSLTEIKVASENSTFKDVDGVVYSKDGKTLVCYPAGKKGAFTIPDSVTEISVAAFSGCISLTDVKFENTRGWKVDGGLVDVTDASRNATYLTDTYADKTWMRQ